ncbi:hypothetical protein BJY24_004844 [Nocardia transvalensis]|uniref:DUF6285 domain-containing protein n=1 Tax=Nocardia transvalensis TaxID=37333 RepID=A0A7W9UK39_9NOCA|nr:DUF6285 domain-containing protein [Nocardia transvalensis]MBB5915932.1 hypothetical protein [Nocardia transvalensis]
MQYRPSATELLDTLAELMSEVLLPELPDALQHRARVGANVARILRRELQQGPGAVERERELLAVAESAGSEEDRWRALVEIVRADLVVSKPGYDAWEGE